MPRLPRMQRTPYRNASRSLLDSLQARRVTSVSVRSARPSTVTTCCGPCTLWALRTTWSHCSSTLLNSGRQRLWQHRMQARGTARSAAASSCVGFLCDTAAAAAACCSAALQLMSQQQQEAQLGPQQQAVSYSGFLLLLIQQQQ